MSSRFYKTLAILFLAGRLQAVSLFAATLPPACGNDKVQFDVKLKNSVPAAAPAPGLAQIIFIEYLNDPNGLADSPIVRFAMDGSWVGATKADASFGDVQKFSYFEVSISPGEHHICSDWLSPSDEIRGEVGLDTLTAEPGKVYYYQLRLSIRPYLVGVGPNKRQLPGSYTHVLNFENIPEVTARDILARAKFSISKPYMK